MSLQIRVEPAEVVAVPGVPVELVATVVNDGATDVTCSLRAVGAEAGWLEGDLDLSIPAGMEAEVPLVLTLPTGFPEGNHLLGIEAAAGRELAVADLTVEVDSLDLVDVRLSPATVHGGWRGRFRLNIRNSGDEPVTVKLTGRGDGPPGEPSKLNFKFKPDEVTLRPGDRSRTKAWVSGPRHAIGAPRRHAITVTAQGRTSPRYASGSFTQRAILSGNVLRVVGIVCVLVIWAATLTSIVHRSSRSGRQTAAETSAEVAPGAGATPDASAGSPPGGGQGTQDTVAPTTGASIAGQVKGPVDPSGIAIKLRPVALADSLPENVVLAASVGDDSSGKESAQTLRREPDSAVGATVSTVTDASGRWAFGGLHSPANYELTFSKAGFGERTYVVSVSDDAPEVALDVDMTAGTGSISGSVVDPDGPLGGVDIAVTDGTVTYKTNTPTTGDVGSWSVDGLATPGTYLVTATRRGYGTETMAIELGNGDSKSGVKLTMVPGVGSLAGTVTGAGSPTGGLLVSATDGKTTLSTTTLTDAPVGSWSIPQLPIPGDYTVTVSGDGWITQTLLVKLTGNATGVNFDLVRTTATIVGTVTGPGGPLAATGITVSQDKPLVKTLSAVDPPGTYELTGLVPGTYVLTFDRADFKTQSVSVTVVAGERKSVPVTMVAQVTDNVPHDASVTGVVRDTTTASPIAGAQVVMNGAPKTTDANGSFVFDKLAPGSYDVTFTHATHQTTTKNVRIGAASTNALDVTMPPFGTLQGLVTDLTATAITNVNVTVDDDPAATGQDLIVGKTATTNATGQYTFANALPTGKYVATFSKSGYQTRTRNFESVSGATVTADIQLIELGSVLGTIQEPASGLTGGFQPLNDVRVQIDKKDSNGVYQPYQTIADADGTYGSNNLEPGDYRVTASKTNYNTVTKLLDGVKLRESRDGSIVLNGTAVAISGFTRYNDSLGNPQDLSGATVTATVVTGYHTLTVFPYIQPDLVTVGMTSTANGGWTIPTASRPIAGTSMSVSVTATGFVSKTLSISAPDTNGDSTVFLVANPRNVTGKVGIVATPAVGTANVTVTLSGGGLSSSRTLTLNNVNVGSTASPNGVAFTFSNPGLSVGTYTLSASVTTSGYSSFSNSSFSVPFGSGAVDAGQIDLNKLGTINLTVTSGGSAVSGATVDLNNAPGGSNVSSQTTNSSGQVSFTNVTPGNYRLDVSKTGFAPGTTATQTLSAGQTLTPSNVVLARYSSVTVDLKSRLDPNAMTALTGATVAIRNPGVTATNVATVGETATPGSYTLSTLAPGTYDLFASAPGHASTTMAFTAVAGTDLTFSPFWLLANPKIRVSIASNQVGYTATPVVGVTATATPVGGGTAVALTAVSGTPGDYITPSLTPGDYAISATIGTGFAPGNVASVSAFVGQTATPSLSLNQWPLVTVHVNKSVAGATSNFSGATVILQAVGSVTHTALYTLTETTANSGDYNVRPTPGTYEVYVSAAAGNDPATSASQTTVAGQADQSAGTLTVNKWPKISALIQEKANNVTADYPTAPAYIVADGHCNDASPGLVATMTVTVGTTATFEASPQPGTAYDVCVIASGHDRAESVGSITTTSGAADVLLAPIVVNKWPKISALIRSNDNGTITDFVGSTATLVAIREPGLSATNVATLTRVGSTATYDNSLITPGTYDLFVNIPGHTATTFSNAITTVSGNLDQSYTAVMQKFANLNVTVNSRVTITNGPTTDSLLTVGVTATATAGALVYDLTHQGSGVYSATALPTGTYTITVGATGHDQQEVTNVSVVAGGATVSRTVFLAAKKGTVVATVRDRNGNGLQGVNVQMQTGGVLFPTVGSTATPSGQFTFTNVPPVTWSVTFTKTTYSPLTVSVTVAKGDAVSVNVDAVLIELGATLTGRTFGQATSGVATDSSVNPVVALSGVSVHLVGQGALTEDRTQVVQDDGSSNYTYGFTDLPAGTYQVTFSQSNYINRVVSVTLSVAQVVNRQDTLLAKTSDIHVSVVDTESSPAAVPGVGLRLTSSLLNTGTYSPDLTTSTPGGTATFLAVPARFLTSATSSAYTLTILSVPTGYSMPGVTATTVAVPAGGADVNVTLTIDKLGNIDLTVTGFLGTDTADVTIAAVATPGTTLSSFTVGATATQHSFTNLPINTALSIGIVATGYTFTPATNVTLTHGQTVSRSVTLTPSVGTLVIVTSGLTLGDTATATISNGGTTYVTTSVGNTSTSYTTADGLPYNTSLTVNVDNTDYTGGGSTSKTLTPGSTATVTVTFSPKDSHLTFTIGSLVGAGATANATFSNAAHADVTGISPGVAQDLVIVPAKAQVGFTATFTSDNYVTQAIVVPPIHSNKTYAIGTVTLVHAVGSINIDIVGLSSTDNASVVGATATATWGAGPGTTAGSSVATVLRNSPPSPSHAFTNLPVGVVITITVTATGPYSTSPNPQTWTLTTNGETKSLTFTFIE